MNNSDKAVNKFKEGYNCAQSVLFSLSDLTGISEDYSLKIGTGFGGGMGRTQHTCGAVTGGILAINHLYGRGLEEGKEKQEDVYSKVQKFINEFEKQHNSIECRDLLNNCDLLTNEGQEQFVSENMAEKCQSYISLVVNIIEKLVKEN